MFKWPFNGLLDGPGTVRVRHWVLFALDGILRSLKRMSVSQIGGHSLTHSLLSKGLSFLWVRVPWHCIHVHFHHDPEFGFFKPSLPSAPRLLSSPHRWSQTTDGAELGPGSRSADAGRPGRSPRPRRMVGLGSSSAPAPLGATPAEERGATAIPAAPNG